MCTALASAILNKPTAPCMAMTGEITLRGDVLPIGGIKQKALAAFRAGIKKVLIPKKNQGDLEEVPKEIKSKVKFVPVERVSDVLWHALGIKMKSELPVPKKPASKCARPLKKASKKKKVGRVLSEARNPTAKKKAVKRRAAKKKAKRARRR